MKDLISNGGKPKDQFSKDEQDQLDVALGVKPADGKTQKDLDLEEYYKSLGEEVPDGSLPKDDNSKVTPPTDGGDVPEFERITDRPWYMVFTTVKYILNIIFICVPWTLFGAALIGFNIFLNIDFNQGWAGGNIWLIANTAYMIIQYVLSIGLIWEIEIWIYYMKFIRIFSLLSAYLYMILYAGALVTLFVILDDLDGSEITWVNMFSVMVLSYNLILHAGILPINLGIAAKEFSMEFIQFVNDWAGSGLDDWSLGMHNIIDLFVAMSNWLNPWWWFAEDDGDKWDNMYE